MLRSQKNTFLGLSLIFLGAFAPQFAGASCYVRADLACTGENSPWPAKSLFSRALLLFSSDVQNSELNCSKFSQLIKAECPTSEPLQYVYTENAASPRSSFILAGDKTLFANRASLSAAFQEYFNGNGLLQVEAETYPVLQKIGTAAASSLYQFVDPSNSNDVMKIPKACDILRNTSSKECGYSVTCKANSNSAVGEFLEVKKVTTDGKVCSLAESLKSILDRTGKVVMNDDSAKVLGWADQAAVTNYAGFGSMPVIAQDDGWLQGLFLEKYGTNYAKDGVCLATAATMVAIALKSESPDSFLGNKFDIIPNQFGDGTAVVPTSPNATTFKTLKYSRHATYVDEMLRMAGLLEHNRGFPQNFWAYRLGVFNGASVSDPVSTPVDFSSNDAAAEANYKNYLANKPTQDYVETNLKSWIQSKKGVVLGLQSQGVVVAARQSEGRVGHANAVASFSGSTYTLVDPWGMVNQVQFSENQQSNIVVTSQDYADCLEAKSRTGSTLLECHPPGNNYQATHQFHLLTHVGAPLPKAAYIGVKFINTSGYSGAYVVGYLTANRWPSAVTAGSIRAANAGQNTLSQVNTAAQTCSPNTIGSITVNGESYGFYNPMSRVTAVGGVNSQRYSSSTAITAGCVGFYSNGQRSDFVGTYTFTCGQGSINILSNNCQPISKTCSIVNGSGVLTPLWANLGNQGYYSQQGSTCRVASCSPGFTLNTSTNTCDCNFTEQISQQKLAGTITSAGTCLFQTTNCPTGTTLSQASTATAPFCINSTTNYATGAGVVLPTYPLKDANGIALAQLPENGNYALNSQGFLEFKGCVSADYEAVSNSNGTTSCSLIQDAIGSTTSQQLALTKKISAARLVDGSCAPGFIPDYERKFCVASLTMCYYDPEALNGQINFGQAKAGAMGLRTFDPEAMYSCRFMGCLEGYTALKYKVSYAPIYNGQIEVPNTSTDTTAYFCAPNKDYVVSDDGNQIVHQPDGRVVSGEFPLQSPDPTDPSYFFGQNLQRSDQQIVNNLNLNTNMDCGKVAPADLGACQMLASLKLPNSQFPSLDNLFAPYGADTTVAAGIQRIRQSAATNTTIPLATFNCGGPDSMAIGGVLNPHLGGVCMHAWSTKASVFGQCLVSNGKGVIVPGKGCMVSSCFAGFSPNPANRACLRTDTRCYRRDLDSGSYVAYAAEVNHSGGFEGSDLSSDSTQVGSLGRYNTCMIQSCALGYRYMQNFGPIQKGLVGRSDVKVSANTSWYSGIFEGFLGKAVYNNSATYHYRSTAENEPDFHPPQFSDACLQEPEYAKYLADKAQAFPQGLPGQLCQFTTTGYLNSAGSQCVPGGNGCKQVTTAFADGVLGYWNSSQNATCLFTNCNQYGSTPKTNSGTVTAPVCNGPIQGNLVQSGTGSPPLDFCPNFSHYLVKADRTLCIQGPSNFNYGVSDTSFLPGGITYLRGNSTSLNYQMYGPRSFPELFNRYLPRYTTGDSQQAVSSAYNNLNRIEYFDIVTQQVVNSTTLTNLFNSSAANNGTLNVPTQKTFYKQFLFNNAAATQTLAIQFLAYPTPLSLYEGATLNPISPIVTGGPATSFTISPSLDGSGLFLDSNTGILSGTPTRVTTSNSGPWYASSKEAQRSTYTITATNSLGSNSTTVDVSVYPQAPSGLSYSLPSEFKLNTPFKLSPSLVSGQPTYYNFVVSSSTSVFNSVTGKSESKVTTYEATETNGLSIDSQGMVTGTPRLLLNSPLIVTVKAGNISGSTTATVALAYPAADQTLTPPQLACGDSVIYRKESPFIYLRSTNVFSNDPSSFKGLQNNGGIALTLNVTPALPSGMSFSEASKEFALVQGQSVLGYKGSIGFSGWPTNLQGFKNYVFTASNPAGSSQVTCPIAVLMSGPEGLQYNLNDIANTATQVKNGPYDVTRKVVASVYDCMYLADPTREDKIPVSLPRIQTAILPKVRTGDPVTYSISPSGGFTVNPNTGALSGTGQFETVYTVSASNAGGSSKNQFCFTDRYGGTFKGLSAPNGLISQTEVKFDQALALPSTPVPSVRPPNLSCLPTNFYRKVPLKSSRGTEGNYDNDAGILSNSGDEVVKYTISPALPLGIEFDTRTGRFGGFPLALTPYRSYTVTGENAGGKSTTTCSFSVLDAVPSNFSYYGSYTYGSFSGGIDTEPRFEIPNCTDLSQYGSGYTAPDFSPGGVATVPSYSVSNIPIDSFALSPTNYGVTINTTNGALSGKPMMGVIYTVSARNSGGVRNAQFCYLDKTVRTVSNPNPSTYRTFTNFYNATTQACSVGNYSFNIAHGTVYRTCIHQNGTNVVGPKTYVGCSSITFQDPTSLTPSCIQCYTDTLTSVTNGVRTMACASGQWAADSTITCNTGFTNIKGQCLFTAGPTTTLAYDPTVPLLRGVAMKPLKPQVTGGLPTSFSIAPALPEGLQMDTQTGVISGVPISPMASTNYTVTAVNAYGNISTTLSFTVYGNLAPTNLSYGNLPNLILSAAMTPVTPTNNGGIVSSFSVTPALPAGLSLNAVTGVLSGTPSVLLSRTNYYVTGKNSLGSTSAVLSLSVVDQAPNSLAYAMPSVIYCGVPLTTINPTFQGRITSYTVLLPPGLTGLSVNATTGVLSGTPGGDCQQASFTSRRYTVAVTGQNTGGSSTVSLDLNLSIAPPSTLSFTGLVSTYVKGQTAINIVARTTGGVPNSFTISPSLPAGVSLNSLTGAITGTATAPAASTIYTVTATNSGGSASATITFAVNDLPPANLNYPVILPLTRNTTVPSITPTWTGGLPTSFTVTPALPTGLTLNSSTGVITGSSVFASPATNYSIVATNSGGSSAPKVISITVNDMAPANLQYNSPMLLTTGQAFTSATPLFSQGAPSSYTLAIGSPALPPGLTLNPTNGKISGTPTTVSFPTIYTIAGSNSTGSSVAKVSIAVSRAGSAGPGINTFASLLATMTSVNNMKLGPDGSIWVLGTQKGGKWAVYKATAGSTTLSQIDATFAATITGEATDIAFDPKNPNIIYLVGFKPKVQSITRRSTDGGVTWTTVDTTPLSYDYPKVNVAVLPSGVAIVKTSESDDSSDSPWGTHVVRTGTTSFTTQISSTNGADGGGELVAIGAKVFWVGSPLNMVAGPLASTTDGIKWTMSMGYPTSYFATKLATDSSGNLYLIGDRLFKSANNGATWTTVSSSFSVLRIIDISINPQGHIYLFGDGVFKSENAGATFTSIFSSRSIGSNFTGFSSSGIAYFISGPSIQYLDSFCSYRESSSACLGPSLLSGVCGWAISEALAIAPTTKLCSVGTASAVTSGTGNFSWTCNGTNGSTQACSVARITSGKCGPATTSHPGTSVPAGDASLCKVGTVVSGVSTNPSTYTWSCSGLNGGDKADCFVTRIIGGECEFVRPSTSAPTGNLCKVGTPSAVSTTIYKSFRWTCAGPIPGTDAICSSTNLSAATCGRATTYLGTSAPTNNLCDVGTASAVSTLTSTFSWTCTGANNETIETCSSPKTSLPVKAICGAATTSTTPFISKPGGDSWLCKVGTVVSGVSTNPSTFTWTCSGFNGGDNADCFVTRIPTGECMFFFPSSSAPTGNLCKFGTPSAISTTTSSFRWTCTGSIPGTESFCGSGRISP
jgi:hypothetical protein